MANTKKKVLFVYGRNLGTLLRESAQGLAPDEFLYGMPYMLHPDLDVEYIDDHQTRSRLSEIPWILLHRWFARRFVIGFYSNIYWRNRPKIQEADVIVTTKDSIGLPILWQSHAGNVKAKIVYISQGLYKVAEKAAGNKINERLRRLIAKWLGKAGLLVVFGHGDAQALKDSFGDYTRIKPQVILFGIDDKFWMPGSPITSPVQNYILSVGSDFLRDYPVLLKAIDDHPLRIVTRQKLPSNLLKPSVIVKSDLDWIELREWYQHAKFVIIPVKNEPRNSGHTSTLQAMACGRAVILSDTPGLWDRERMKHLETCYLVKPENVEALREAISFLLAHPEEASRIGNNARKLVEQHYSSRIYGKALQEAIISVCRDIDAPRYLDCTKTDY